MAVQSLVSSMGIGSAAQRGWGLAAQCPTWRIDRPVGDHVPSMI